MTSVARRAAAIGLAALAPVLGSAPALAAATRLLSPSFFPGWDSANVAHPFVVFDVGANLYRMCYAAAGRNALNDSTWDQWVVGIATSSDTVTWRRNTTDFKAGLYARLFLDGEFVDPDENSGIFDSMAAFGACVIKDGTAWKMWYTGWNGDRENLGGGLARQINFRIGYASSADGTTWTKQAGGAGAGAVLGLGSAGQADAKGASQPVVLKEGSTYRLWYEGFNGSAWRILYATSSDGLTWTKQGVALQPGGAGSLDERGVRNPVVITRAGHYELWYQGQSAAVPNYHVMRATSPDGTSWTKAGQVTLTPDSPIAGSEQIHADSIIVKPDNSLLVFFAKQITTTTTGTYGQVSLRQFHIYSEVVNP